MEQKKKNVALSSVFASLLLTLLKLAVGLITGSIGILSEAAHSGLDLVAASITYWAVRVSHKPADQIHPYGHGKFENISALAETFLLFLTCGWIIYEALKRLTTGKVEIEIAWYSFAVMIISIIIDYSRSRSLNKIAKESNSQALEADALHFSSDIYSSLVVIAGLVFVILGVKGADAFAAIGVALFVLFISYKLGRRTIDVLVDTAPKGLTEKVKDIVLKTEGVVQIDRIRLRPSGPSYFIDMIIGISRKIPLETMNKITKNIETNVQKEIQGADVVVHIKPLTLKDETIVEQIQIMAVNQSLSVHDVSVQTIDDKKFVSFDLEVNSKLSLEKAHKEADSLEKIIKRELGENIEVNAHIEPLEPVTISGAPLSDLQMQLILKILDEIKREIKSINNIHDVSGREVKKKLFITLHCELDKKIPLEDAHNVSTRIEYLMKEKLPNVERTIVHAEPGYP
ncbi:MAG: cation-efflux pump [Patescibacteria group bacterium]|nr:cation-efflux pump [Patescibacteria group bacterium]